MSKALQRIAATMAALGIAVPDARFLMDHGRGRITVSKHAFNKSTRLAGRRSRCKLQIARGAGSISAKSDILALARENKFAAALSMAQNHTVQCGERIFPQHVLDTWAQYAIEELT